MTTAAEATANDYTLRLQHRFGATAERVFDAWLDPAAISSWFTPGPGVSARVESMDARVGGRFAIEVNDPGCNAHLASGEYLVIERPRRLAFTWSWNTEPDIVMLITLDLETDGEQTVLTLTHEKLPSEGYRDDHEAGWKGCFAGLADYLAA